MAAVLEFSGGQRAPFAIDRSEVIIGRGGGCALRVEGAAAEQHARLTVDGGGIVHVQDLDTQTGTLRNGNFVYGVQPLEDGDELNIGGVQLIFRLRALANVVTPRAGADDRTRMPTELPPEVRAALAARDAAAAAPPAGIVVGKAQPEPENFRTVQMTAPDLAALGIDPATLPPIATPANPSAPPSFAPPRASSAPVGARPVVAPAAPVSAKRTMIGMPAVQLPVPMAPSATPPAPKPPAREAWTPSPSLAQPTPPQATPQQATMMAEAPQLPLTPKPAPRTAQLDAQPAPIGTQPTMMAQAPLVSLPQATPQQATPQQATMMAEAPQLPLTPKPAPRTAQLDAQPAPIGTQPTMMAQAPLVPPAAQPLAAPAALPYAPSATNPPNANAAHANAPAQAYTPPPKGAFGSFSRALAFMTQIFTLARTHKTLVKPLVWDVLVTTPVMAAFTVLLFFVHSRNGFYACMAVEGFLLYFIDYACNSITCSLMYDYGTTGAATMETALPRVKRALPGIMTFAAVSALLDLAATYARERNDVAARLVLRLLRAIWTTATYVIMPALVIEGVSFGAAFKRSKALMDHDPTGVGAGVVAMSITSYIVAAICFPLAWVVMRALGYIHPAIGALGGMLIVNLYWSVSGWMKIAYSTCFYMWARECERTGATDHALAPLPLRAALDAA